MIGSISQNYISDDLTHFIGRNLSNESCRYSLLKKILKIGCLSNSELNAAKPCEVTELQINGDAKLSKNEMYIPQMVCFCDIPISQLSIHISKYGKFGLAFSKNFIIANKGIPVHYIPKQAKESDSICKGEFYDIKAERFINYMDNLNEDIKDIIIEFHTFLNFNVFSYVKFFDHTLRDSDPKNYYFEREWRVLGNLRFKDEDIKRVFIPTEFCNDFKKEYPRYSDRVYAL